VLWGAVEAVDTEWAEQDTGPGYSLPVPSAAGWENLEQPQDHLMVLEEPCTLHFEMAFLAVVHAFRSKVPVSSHLAQVPFGHNEDE